MNRTEIKKMIAAKKSSLQGFNINICEQKKLIEQQKAYLKKAEEKLEESKQQNIHIENSIILHEKMLHDESMCKRAVTLMLKKYPELGLDDESDDEHGGTYLWLYCNLFDEHNEEDDPYYDFHYMDDWEECLERCETYIQLIERKREVA